MQDNNDAEGLVRSEEEFSRTMAEELFDGVDDVMSDNLDLYQIQADELDDDLDMETELQKLALEFFPEEEEEKIAEVQTEADRLFEERARQIIEMSAQFSPCSLSGDHKCANAGYYGGFSCTDKALMSRLRSAASEIVKAVGKKLFSGNFDLTKISFPIKCMAPVSTLELMPTLQSTMPIYLNRAAMTSDPVERMKLVISHSISFFYKEKIFEKPLNPILGETFQARG